jgi:hypothetical protein
MRLKALTTLLFVGTVACDDTLTLAPTSEVEEGSAIVDAATARAALAGAYDALQSGSYYGGTLLFFSDLLSEDVEHTGTFSSYVAADANRMLPDNESMLPIWTALYRAIGVANQLIVRVPNVAGIAQADADDILGQARLIRALSYHHLVKLWGDVPMPLAPPASIEAAGSLTKSTVAEVYTQILADLAAGETMIANTSDTRKATPDAAVALRSRVMLFQGNWQGVIDAATSLEGSYSLAANYSDLFTADGQDTPEDIFRVSFTPVEFTNVGFFYISRSFGGRWEIAPTVDLINAYGESSDPTFDPDTVTLTNAFNPADERAAWNIAFDARRRNYGSKFPTPIGAEDVHVIRFGEVILNKAEAYARRNSAGDLVLAINEVNRIRGRVAGAPALTAVGLTQQQVLDLIWRERRLELAMEGFAWPDLVRTGRAVAVMAPNVAAFEVLWPIPRAELDVSPNVFQNPGY